MKRILLALVSGWLALAAVEACSSSSSNSPFGNQDAGGNHDGTASSSSGGSGNGGEAASPTEAGEDGTTAEAGTDALAPADSAQHDAGLDASEEPATEAGEDETGPECGSTPTLHVDEAGSIFCGIADGGDLLCPTGQECCLGGALGGGQFAPQECATLGAACPNIGVPDAGAAAIPIECAQISDCVADGVIQAAACCLQGATAPAVTPGCTYPKSSLGTAVVCESGQPGTTAPIPCATGEVQLCSSQVDCPTGTTCMPGKWKIFQVGFCL
jgi:hypothetical protein